MYGTNSVNEVIEIDSRKDKNSASSMFPVQPMNEQGYIKTSITDKLAILSKLVYWMPEYHFFNQKPNQNDEQKPAEANIPVAQAYEELDEWNSLGKIESEQNPLFTHARYVDFLPHINDLFLVDFDGYSAFVLDEKNKLAIFVFRGTKFYNLFDIGNGIAIAYSNRPFCRIRFSKQFMLPHLEWLKTTGRSAYRLILTGHSLGGSVAEYLTMDEELDIEHCETFNTGTSPFYTISQRCRDLRIYSNKIITHHIKWDHFSTGRLKGAVKDQVQPNFFFPHAMIHFLENIENLSNQITEEHNKVAKLFKQKRIDYRQKASLPKPGVSQ